MSSRSFKKKKKKKAAVEARTQGGDLLDDSEGAGRFSRSVHTKNPGKRNVVSTLSVVSCLPFNSSFGHDQTG